MITTILVAKQVQNRHIVVGTFHQGHRIPRLDLTLVQDTKIDTGALRLPKMQPEAPIAHPRRKGIAGNARRRRFEHDLADQQAVANAHVGGHIPNRQILPEEPGKQLPSGLLRPPVIVIGAIGINCLVSAPVVPHRDDRVAGQPVARHLYRTLDRILADSRLHCLVTE